MNLDAEIEAILYYKSEPVSIDKLAKSLAKNESEIEEGISKLRTRLKDSGLVLISKDDLVTLGTAPSLSPLVERMVKEDLAKDIGRASVDTLTIILYYGPISKSKIDNIRGVNSGFILRNLLIRGLIMRSENEIGERSFLYKPTVELLSYLGIKSIDELPEYEELRETLNKNLIELGKNEKFDSET